MFPDVVFCKSFILSFISGLERCHVRILFHWDTGNPCSFSFVVFWFVRQINCEMNIKREIEASVINHLLALSLRQCHYTHTHAHAHTGTENAFTCVFISETTHVFMMCPMEEQWDKTRCTMQLQKCHINGMQL